MVSVRIVSVEYYMCYPVPDLDITYSEFRNLEVRQLPVIQVFGSTESGQKTCLNVHGVFPYLYIPYDGLEPSGSLSYKIALELDKCINISLGQATSNAVHVHNVVLVSGTPIYGYHEKPHQFLKIYFYNPAIVKKACTLLENGTILGKCFQPHEVHINYILQFTIDYNLHGMSFINVSHVKYRHNPDYPDYLSDISADLILPKSLLPRSVNKLEMDALASDITNVDEIRNGVGVNPGIAAIWNDERQRRREQNLDSQISFSLTQERKLKPVPTASDRLFNTRLQEKLTQDSAVIDDKAALNNSVYPAETPDDVDIGAASNTSVFDVTFQDDTLTTKCLDEFTQKDKNLLDILQELKETAHIEEDSILSQQTPVPMNDNEISSDEEADNLSNPLDQSIGKVIDDVAVNNNFDPWADSFWDDNVAVPQLDGIHDTDVGDSQSESTDKSQKSNAFARYADKVYVNNARTKMSPRMCLDAGSNTLILTKPKNESIVPISTKVKILSDIPVKIKKHFFITHKIDDIEPASPAIENYTPLCIDDWDYRSLINQEDLNNVLVHDVNMGISLLDDSCQLKQNVGSSKMSYFSTKGEDETLNYEYSSGNESFNEKENINENVTKHLCSKKYEQQLCDSKDKKGKQGTQNCGNASNHRTVRKLTGNNNSSKKNRSQSEDSHFNNNNTYEFNDSYISSRVSDTNINLKIKHLNSKYKNQFCNKNLDGADDTPTSGSNSSAEENKNIEEKQQKKRLKHCPSPSRNKSSKTETKNKCRILGLAKPSVKKTKNKSKKNHLSPASQPGAFVKKEMLSSNDENSNDSIFPSVKPTKSFHEEEILNAKILTLIEPTISTEKTVKKLKQKSEKAVNLKPEVTVGSENVKKRKRSGKKMAGDIQKVDITNVTSNSASAVDKDQIVPSIKIVRKCDRGAKVNLQTDSYLHQDDIETSSVNDYEIVQNTKNDEIFPAAVRISVRPKKRPKKIESDSSIFEVVKIHPEVREVSTNSSDEISTEKNSGTRVKLQTNSYSHQDAVETSSVNDYEVMHNKNNTENDEIFPTAVKKSVKLKKGPKKIENDSSIIEVVKINPEVTEVPGNYSDVIFTENKKTNFQKHVKKYVQSQKISNPSENKDFFQISPLKICSEVSNTNSNNKDFVLKKLSKNANLLKKESNRDSCKISPLKIFSEVSASNTDDSVTENMVSNRNQNFSIPEFTAATTFIQSDLADSQSNLNDSSKEISQQLITKYDPPEETSILPKIVLLDVTGDSSSVESIEVPAFNSKEKNKNLQQSVKRSVPSIQSEIVLSDATVDTPEESIEVCASNSRVYAQEKNTTNLQQLVKKIDQPKKVAIRNDIVLSYITLETYSVNSILEVSAANSEAHIKENNTNNLQKFVKKIDKTKKAAIQSKIVRSDPTCETSAIDSILEVPAKEYKTEDLQRSIKKYDLFKRSTDIIETTLPEVLNPEVTENKSYILESIKKLNRPQEQPISEITSNFNDSASDNKTQIIDLPVNNASEKNEAAVEICSNYANPENSQFSSNLNDSKIENVAHILQSPIRKRGRPKKLPITPETKWIEKSIKAIPVNSDLEFGLESNQNDFVTEQKAQIFHSPVRKKGRAKKASTQCESSSDKCASTSPTEILDNIVASTFDDLSVTVNKAVRKRGKPKKSSKLRATSNLVDVRTKLSPVNDEIITTNNIAENVVNSSFIEDHCVKTRSRSKKPLVQKVPLLSKVKDKIDLPLKSEIADYLNKLNMTETHALEQLQNINVKIEDSSSALELLSKANKDHIAKKLFEEIKVNNCDTKSNKYTDFKKMSKDTSESVTSKKPSSKRFRKKMSLQKRSEGSENLENAITPVLKDLRVNLTRVDNLVNKHNKFKELRVVLERLNMEKILAEKMKAATSSNDKQPSVKVKKGKSKRVPITSLNEESFDSLENIAEPQEEQKQKLPSSPKRNIGKKINSTLKYSPLPVVIKSPKKKVAAQSPKRTVTVKSPKRSVTLEKTRTKISTRSSVLTTANLKTEDNVTETVKVPGIGEFLALSLEKRQSSEETENHARTLKQAIKNKPWNDCDTRNQNNELISSTNAVSIISTPNKILAINSIKKKLFSDKKIQSQDDFGKRDPTTWKQNEENFLDEIDAASEISRDTPKDYLFFANKYNSEGCYLKSPTQNDLNTVNNVKFKYSCRNTRNESISNSTNTDNVTFKTPDKKSVITSDDYLDYSPFNSIYNTPQKSTQSESLVFTPRETLSQQCEKELYDKNYSTKTDNLTIAERYDLKRNFAPQPGSSNFPDLVINTQDESVMHTNHTQRSIESFHTSFNFSEYVASQNLTTLDESIIQFDSKSRIWMPKFNPPTVRDVKNTMEQYNIPKHRFQFPFYGDHSDVTKKVDVGSNVLKIPSKAVSELEEFCSSVNYEGLEQWRKKKFENTCPDAAFTNKSNLRVTLASNSEFIMTPAKPPPSKKYILKWLQLKNDVKQEEYSIKTQKIKIRIPRSPGHDNESGDESIIMSPCTPDSINSISQTTKSNGTTPVSFVSSPIFLHKKAKRKGLLQRKKLFPYPQPTSKKQSSNSNDSCQITGISLDNTHGFKLSYENLQDAKAITEHQYLTILVMELHVRTRAELFPDPQYDAIRAIFYSIANDVPDNSVLPNKETGILFINSLPISPTKNLKPLLEGSGINCEVVCLNSELELIEALIKLIKKWDPDIVTGFEIEMQSWGYFIERCYVLGINVLSQISRSNPALLKNKTVYFEPSQEIKLHGRIVLDSWRLFRSEIALTSYTFENLMYHILHKRKPTHSYKDLSFWWDHRSNYYRHITAKYYIDRVEGILQLMDQLDLIGRTSELARLFGIQFYEVLSRGSQFRVESMMLRLAKPMNYIAVSPSVQQRAKMRAPEWIPLIFEPQSRFYADPVIVLDFQSLYPSIMIAYNYCFSTCAGRINKLGTDQVFEFGACQLRLAQHKLKNIKDDLSFSPCGVGFVSTKIRQGILPRMLKEILETRLMVKASMKANKDNKILQRVLHSRQLGLKLIANVTYGYTAANYSGRMPCSEVADSVVSKGRETLERAIKLIEDNAKWKAKVVYGDTDSVFVLLQGRSREEAFKIGEEIAESVTNDNPPPVKLKLEKIYQPCILQTKKRYVGYMYESVDQKEPEYNAKGIETVRRDGCPAIAKMLEKSLRTLFETQDVSLVKRYVIRQFEKLISGRVSIQDLTFAREFRGAGGYRPGACVPSLELARKWTAVDKRREPRRGERVPYIIVHGPPGVPLIKLVRCPKELMGTEQSSQGLRPNAEYYITRVIIPALNRCFALIGANMHAWYNDMPRKQLSTLPTDIHFEKSKKSTISQYFATINCAVCGLQTTDGLCDKCSQKPQKTLVTLNEKIWRWERNFTEVIKICESCCGRGEQIQCISLDCPVLYRLLQTSRDLKQVPFLRTLIDKF